MIVWALFGCVAPGDDSGAPLDTAPSDTDSAGDTDSAADTDTAGDTDSATDTDTAGDTDTAAPILAGALSVEGTWRGAPFVVTCTEADGDAVFVRYWSDAVGNVAGTVGCYRAEDPRPWAAVTFSSAATGEWSEPADATWMIGDTAGAWGLRLGREHRVGARHLALRARRPRHLRPHRHALGRVGGGQRRRQRHRQL